MVEGKRYCLRFMHYQRGETFVQEFEEGDPAAQQETVPNAHFQLQNQFMKNMNEIS